MSNILIYSVEINQILLWAKLGLFIVAAILSSSKEFESYTFSEKLKMMIPTSSGKKVIRSEHWNKLKWFRFVCLGIELLLVLRVLISLAVLGLFRV